MDNCNRLDLRASLLPCLPTTIPFFDNALGLCILLFPDSSILLDTFLSFPNLAGSLDWPARATLHAYWSWRNSLWLFGLIRLVDFRSGYHDQHRCCLISKACLQATIWDASSKRVFQDDNEQFSRGCNDRQSYTLDLRRWARSDSESSNGKSDNSASREVIWILTWVRRERREGARNSCRLPLHELTSSEVPGLCQGQAIQPIRTYGV